MPITTIPAPYRRGFAIIKRLPPADFEAFVAALQRAPAPAGLRGIVSAVVQQMSGLKRDEVESVLRTVYSLCGFLTDEDAPLAEHLSELANAMNTSGRPELALSEQEGIEFQSRLNRLLGLNTVVISAKVERLRLEYPKTFHDAAIFSDLRPVFDGPEERPVGCAITHTLKVEYHEGGEHKEFYVVLDEDDIRKMKKVVQRAEAKAASLRSLLRLAAVPDLSV